MRVSFEHVKAAMPQHVPNPNGKVEAPRSQQVLCRVRHPLYSVDVLGVSLEDNRGRPLKRSPDPNGHVVAARCEHLFGGVPSDFVDVACVPVQDVDRALSAKTADADFSVTRTRSKRLVVKPIDVVRALVVVVEDLDRFAGRNRPRDDFRVGGARKESFAVGGKLYGEDGFAVLDEDEFQFAVVGPEAGGAVIAASGEDGARRVPRERGYVFVAALLLRGVVEDVIGGVGVVFDLPDYRGGIAGASGQIMAIWGPGPTVYIAVVASKADAGGGM